MTVPCRGRHFRMYVNGFKRLENKKTGHAFLTFSEALANFVPDALNARAARGLSWAWIRVRVLYRRSDRSDVFTWHFHTKKAFSRDVTRAATCPTLVARYIEAHQTIGIVEGDFPHGGTARVRQVGVTVVDRQSAETCERVQRISPPVHWFLLTTFQQRNGCIICQGVCSPWPRWTTRGQCWGFALLLVILFESDFVLRAKRFYFLSNIWVLILIKLDQWVSELI